MADVRGLGHPAPVRGLPAQVGSGANMREKFGESLSVPQAFAFALPPGLHESRTPQVLRRAPQPSSAEHASQRLSGMF
jgi:hypothetical protein